MADMKIEDATRVASVGGSEIVPVSLNAAAKSATAEQFKDYVKGVIDTLAKTTDVTISSTDSLCDGIYIQHIGANNVKTITPISASKISDEIFNHVSTKNGSAGSLLGSDSIIIKRDGFYHSTTVGDVLVYIEGNIDNGFDIHAKSDSDALDDDDYVAVSQQVGTTSVWNTLKSTLSTFAAYVIGKIASVAISTSAIGSGDYILVLTGSPLTLKRVTRTNASFASGDVTGPSDAIQGKIPQWSTNGGKGLTSGLAVVSSITDETQTSDIPNVSAISNYFSTIGGVKCGEETTTENKIPQWDEDSKILKDGLTLQTSIRASGSATDTALATESAVRAELDNRVTIGTAGSAGKILVWGPGGTATTNIDKVVSVTSSATDTEIPTARAVYYYVDNLKANIVSSGSTHAYIPTAKAVYDFTQNLIVTSIDSESTNGYIPGAKAVRDFFNGSRVTSISSSSTDDKVPSAKAVYDFVVSQINAHLAAYAHAAA